MKNFILSKTKALIVCFLFTSSFTIAQTTHIVNNDVNAESDFTDLQTAIDAATSGDIIYVQQSATSYGSITINKSLTLIGRSHSDASYKSETGNITLDVGASNTTIKGFKISNISETALAGTISDLAFFDNDISSILLGSGSTIFNNVLIQGNVFRSSIDIYSNTTNVLITNNLLFTSSMSFYMTNSLLFSNNIISYPGINVYNYSTGNLNVSNSIFLNSYLGVSEVNISNQSTGTVQIDNCLTYNFDGTSTYNFNTGIGVTINANVQENTDPLFTNANTALTTSIAYQYVINYDPINDDLTLQAGSPVSDDGLFEGYNFKNFGTPTGLPSLKITSYSSTVPKNGNLSVTIEAKTN